MDIGTLTGEIELDDRITSGLETVLRSVESFSTRIVDGLGLVGIAATATVTAISGIAYSIVEIGKHGSAMADVEAGFHRLAGGVDHARLIMEEMQKGTKGTIDDLFLMTQANKLLQAGFKGTAEDFGAITAGARVLSREGFGPLETIMSQVDRALQTGQVARLGRIGLTLNVRKAEEDLAKSLHVTVQELSPLGVLEAKRIATLTALRKTIADAGDQELSFKELIEQTSTAIDDWVDNLRISIGTSSHVIDAYKAVKNAIMEAFGGNTQAMADRILQWVNDFADATTEYGPKVVRFFVDTYNAVERIYSSVVGAWRAIPQWIRDIGVEAGITTVAIYALAGGLTKIGEASVIGSLLGAGRGVASVVKAVKDYSGALIGLGASGAIRTVLLDITAWWNGVAVAEYAALGWVALIVGGIVAIYEAWKHWDTLGPMFDRFLLWATGATDKQLAHRDAVLQTNQALAEQARKFDDIAASAAMAGMIKPDLTPLGELLKTAPKFGAEGPGIFKGGEMTFGPTEIPEGSNLIKDKGAEAAEAHSKAVKELLDTLRNGSKEVKVFHDVFSQLTDAQRADLGVQTQLLPMYMKGIETRQQMTAAESAWFAASLRARDEERLRQEQSLAFRHITLQMIDARKLAGQTEQEIAAQFRVSTDALKDYTDRITFAQKEHKNLADVVKMSSAEYVAYRQYVQLAKEEQQGLNQALIYGSLALDNYDSQLQRARESADIVRRGAEIQAQSNLTLTALKAQGAAELSLAESQLKYDEMRGASAKRIFIDSQNIERLKYEIARREAEAQFELQNKTVVGYAQMAAAHKISMDQMDRDFEASNALRIAIFERTQNKWYQTLDSIQGRLKRLGDSITSNIAGTFFGIGEDIDGHLHAAATRAHDAYVQIAADGKHTASELANAFRAWRDAEDAANSSFGERIKSVWYGIKKTIVDVLNDIQKYFTERFIVGLVKGMTGAKLGESFGSLLGGGGGGGGGLSSWANTGTNLLTGGKGNLLGNLLSLGGGGVATTGVGAAASLGTSAGVSAGMGAGALVTPPTFLAGAPALGATGGGVIAGSSAAPTAAATGGGFGSTLTALATNPITWAAAGAAVLAWGIKSKGWFRGGEEGVKVNPARNKFLTENFAQYDPPEIHDTKNPKGYHGLAGLLSLRKSEPLFAALTSSKKMKDFQTAEQRIAQNLAGRHITSEGKELPRITSIKLFQQGGFVPPGATQLGALHGGGAGELVGPIGTLSKMIETNLAMALSTRQSGVMTAIQGMTEELAKQRLAIARAGDRPVAAPPAPRPDTSSKFDLILSRLGSRPEVPVVTDRTTTTKLDLILGQLEHQSEPTFAAPRTVPVEAPPQVIPTPRPVVPASIIPAIPRPVAPPPQTVLTPVAPVIRTEVAPVVPPTPIIRVNAPELPPLPTIRVNAPEVPPLPDIRVNAPEVPAPIVRMQAAPIPPPIVNVGAPSILPPPNVRILAPEPPPAPVVRVEPQAPIIVPAEPPAPLPVPNIVLPQAVPAPTPSVVVNTPPSASVVQPVVPPAPRLSATLTSVTNTTNTRAFGTGTPATGTSSLLMSLPQAIAGSVSSAIAGTPFETRQTDTLASVLRGELSGIARGISSIRTPTTIASTSEQTTTTLPRFSDLTDLLRSIETNTKSLPSKPVAPLPTPKLELRNVDTDLSPLTDVLTRIKENTEVRPAVERPIDFTTVTSALDRIDKSVQTSTDRTKVVVETEPTSLQVPIIRNVETDLTSIEGLLGRVVTNTTNIEPSSVLRESSFTDLRTTEDLLRQISGHTSATARGVSVRPISTTTVVHPPKMPEERMSSTLEQIERNTARPVESPTLNITPVVQPASVELRSVEDTLSRIEENTDVSPTIVSQVSSTPPTPNWTVMSFSEKLQSFIDKAKGSSIFHVGSGTMGLPTTTPGPSELSLPTSLSDKLHELISSTKETGGALRILAGSIGASNALPTQKLSIEEVEQQSLSINRLTNFLKEESQPFENRVAELNALKTNSLLEEILNRTPDRTAPVPVQQSVVVEQVGSATRRPTSGDIIQPHLWNITIEGGMLDRDNVRKVFKDHIIPLHRQAAFLDEDGYGEAIRRTMG